MIGFVPPAHTLQPSGHTPKSESGYVRPSRRRGTDAGVRDAGSDRHHGTKRKPESSSLSGVPQQTQASTRTSAGDKTSKE
ncbi:hypothetical protein JOQ06_010630, partial [Pogonophryne albipinna]